MPQDYKALQNGSDIRGIALPGVPGEDVNLTPEAAEKIASAFACWLSRKTGRAAAELRVTVGGDSRLSTPALRDAVAEGLALSGAAVIDCGLCSTPAMFMTTVLGGWRFDGAVMVTASHLPFNRNGLKFFTPAGGLESEEIAEVLALADGISAPAARKGSIVKTDFLPVYAGTLVQKIRAAVNDPDDYDRPLKGLKIVVDAGNGAGGFFASQVLEPLGVDTAGSQFLEPDGRFPNHIPNPENKAAMDSLRAAVLHTGADLGVIFDTDVDRAGAVGRTGDEINRNRIIALASAIVLEEHPGTVIVTDSVTSDELTAFIEETLGGVHRRFMRGYKNVIDEAIRLNSAGTECWLAMETSGHGALKENYFLDDGAYLTAKILAKAALLRRAGKTVDELTASLGEPLEAQEFRLKITATDFKSAGAGILQKLGEYAAGHPDFHVVPHNFEGVRVSFGKGDGDGWFLLRMSLHEPLLPLNIESREAGGVKVIASKLYAFLQTCGALELASMRTFLL